VTALKHEIAQGRDPAAEHAKQLAVRRVADQHAAANTFAGAARGFIEMHASVKVRRWEELARLLGLQPPALSIIPKGLADRWGERPVASIDGHDIYGVIDEARRIGVPGLDSRSDKPSEARARHLFGVLSKLFAWLIQQRRVTVNPCVGVHRPETPKARDRVLSNSEIARFWKAADATGEPVAGLLKLLLLTGCRLNEVAGMRWSELSDDGASWLIPGERTKNHRPHIVPLTSLVREIIDNAKRIEGCDFVFSNTGSSPISGWSKVKDRIDAAMKPATPWVLHDLRRTAATGMAEIGIAPHIVEAVLNHVSGARAGVAGTYNRAQYLPEKTAALKRWAVHVQGLAAGKQSNVTALRGRRA